MNFQRICDILTAKRCAASGMHIDEIARQSGKSRATIRRWLKV